MAPLYSSFILLYLLHHFLCQAQYKLSIAPQNPVVSLWASVQLNCSINCPGGSTAWKGLDTNLGGLYIGTGFSVLNIQNASISMEGTMICVGICPGADKKHYMGNVVLHVYALPESLLLSAHPESEPPSLHCFMRAAFVTSEIKVKWFKGLESLRSSNQDEKWYEDENGLSYYTWILPVAGDAEWAPGTSYRCEVEIDFSGHVFTREGILHLPPKDTTVINAVTSQTVGLHATSAESSTIIYTVPSSKGYTKTLHKVLNPTQEYESKLPMDTGTQAVLKSPSESHTQLITATIPSSILPVSEENHSSHPVRRFTTAMPTAFQKVFQTVSAIKRNTTKTVSTNINILRYFKTLTGFQGTSSVSLASHTTEHGSTMKESQTSIHSYNTQPGNLKMESLSSISAEGTTTQTMSVEHPSTPLPPVPQSSMPNSWVRLSPSPSPTTIGQFESSQEIPATNEIPITTVPKDGLALTWTIVPAFGLIGSLMLSFRLWRALKQKGSFIPKQLYPEQSWSVKQNGISNRQFLHLNSP
ncbi:hypothetical protein XENTR_v10001433 [Xenopus tropicalis]|uniref:Mucosal addressin cell adhesion molecule 1 n=1 Tax=Xenopus tropicalis TaxID=8364 RepID=A0A6I8Q579_XENTR|nr:mucosal addressin cell adhesion molecule 1 [Xenopus tropicalis]KAE8632109.1 hypothetical protein XENTR_v10001433 [Xenopus tropicalis]